MVIVQETSRDAWHVKIHPGPVDGKEGGVSLNSGKTSAISSTRACALIGTADAASVRKYFYFNKLLLCFNEYIFSYLYIIFFVQRNSSKNIISLYSM